MPGLGLRAGENDVRDITNAEAGGNRTRQRRDAPSTGFEDRGATRHPDASGADVTRARAAPDLFGAVLTAARQARDKTRVEGFGVGSVGEGLAGVGVELVGDGVEAGLGSEGQVGSSGCRWPGVKTDKCRPC
jgi:hypothetical protein